MTRYYFFVRGGAVELPDKIGTLLPSDSVALSLAKRIISGLLRATNTTIPGFACWSQMTPERPCSRSHFWMRAGERATSPLEFHLANEGPRLFDPAPQPPASSETASPPEMR